MWPVASNDRGAREASSLRERPVRIGVSARCDEPGMAHRLSLRGHPALWLKFNLRPEDYQRTAPGIGRNASPRVKPPAAWREWAHRIAGRCRSRPFATDQEPLESAATACTRSHSYAERRPP